MEAFAQFGSDLDAATQKLLGRGSRLTELLKQGQYSPLLMEEQVLVIFAGVKGYLDAMPLHKIKDFEQEIIREIRHKHPKIFESIQAEGKMSPEIEKQLHDILSNLVKIFA
jgi:F-type H+-transporting ATPase subunit alpha